MHDKLNELLSEATGWRTAAELAEKGGWRSPAHVGLALKQMPGVESRMSPTKKMMNGMPAKEYKLIDKHFPDDIKAAPRHEKPKADKPEKTTACIPEDSPQKRVEIRRQPDDQALQIATRNHNLLCAIHDALCLPDETGYSEMPRLVTELRAAVVKQAKHILELEETIRTTQNRAEVAENAGIKLSSQVAELQLAMENAGKIATRLANQYLVKTPNKPPRFTKKHAKAQNVALSAARQHGLAEVFELVPVGKAIRGAEWKPSK